MICACIYKKMLHQALLHKPQKSSNSPFVCSSNEEKKVNDINKKWQNRIKAREAKQTKQQIAKQQQKD